MSDKVQLIKQEIGRLSDEYPMSRGLLKHLNKFIDSLPEEPVSEDLDREIGYYTTSKLLKKRDHSTGIYHLTQKECDNIARHFAEWGRNHFEDKSEMVSENLEGRSINALKSFDATMTVVDKHRPFELSDFVKESFIPD